MNQFAYLSINACLIFHLVAMIHMTCTYVVLNSRDQYDIPLFASSQLASQYTY